MGREERESTLSILLVPDGFDQLLHQLGLVPLYPQAPLPHVVLY
jgi:hypothetical protein